jgi:hypothetical protein
MPSVEAQVVVVPQSATGSLQGVALARRVRQARVWHDPVGDTEVQRDVMCEKPKPSRQCVPHSPLSKVAYPKASNIESTLRRPRDIT